MCISNGRIVAVPYNSAQILEVRATGEGGVNVATADSAMAECYG